MNKLKKIALLFLLTIFCLTPVILSPPIADATLFNARTLTGGSSTSLDGINGRKLKDGDRAWVLTTSTIYFYYLDADSAASESSPDIISPDSNAGDKRWILAAHTEACDGVFNFYLSDFTTLAVAASTLNALNADCTLVIDTDYTMVASVSFDAEVTLQFAPGNVITSTAYALMVGGGPAKIIAGPTQQCFAGTGTVAFSVAGIIYPGWFGFSTSASAANNSTYLGYVITSMTAGSTINFSPGTFSASGQITINKACKLEGQGTTLDWASDTSANRGLLVTASNVEIRGLTLDGPQYASSVATQNAIKAYGADSSNYISGLKVKGCKILNWGQYGIVMEFVENFDISGWNDISYCYQALVQGLSAKKGKIEGNYLHDLVSAAGGGVYGIALSHTTGPIATYPMSTDVTVKGNYVDNITNWEGLDTHGGQRIVFDSNVVTNCYIGINAGPAVYAGGGVAWAPDDIIISNNTLDSGVTDGSAYAGIQLSGHSMDAEIYATGSIIGNTVRGYGSDGATGNACAIFLSLTQGVRCDNVLINSSQYGYRLNDDCLDISISGTIIDCWADTGSTSYGIYCNDVVTGVIDGVTFKRTGAFVAKAHDFSAAIRVSNIAGSQVLIGHNSCDNVPIYIYDPGSKCFRGSLTAVSSDGTSEDTLISYVVPEDMLGSNNRIHVVASGSITGANGNKTLKFYFGATSWTFYPAANHTDDWKLDAYIWMTAVTSQKVSIMGYDGTTIVYNDDSTAAIDTTAADTTIKITGECAHVDDVITNSVMWIELQ